MLYLQLAVYDTIDVQAGNLLIHFQSYKVVLSYNASSVSVEKMLMGWEFRWKRLVLVIEVIYGRDVDI